MIIYQTDEEPMFHALVKIRMGNCKTVCYSPESKVFSQDIQRLIQNSLRYVCLQTLVYAR